MHVFGVLYMAEMYGKLKRSTTFNATLPRYLPREPTVPGISWPFGICTTNDT